MKKEDTCNKGMIQSCKDGWVCWWEDAQDDFHGVQQIVFWESKLKMIKESSLYIGIVHARATTLPMLLP